MLKSSEKTTASVISFTFSSACVTMTADKAYKERYMRIICEDEKIVKGFEIFTKRFTLLAEKTVRAAKSEDGKTSAEL